MTPLTNLHVMGMRVLGETTFYLVVGVVIYATIILGITFATMTTTFEAAPSGSTAA